MEKLARAMPVGKRVRCWCRGCGLSGAQAAAGRPLLSNQFPGTAVSSAPQPASGTAPGSPGRRRYLLVSGT